MRVIQMTMKQKLKVLKDSLAAHVDSVTPAMLDFFDDKPKYIIFLSASNMKSRAHVVHSTGNTFEASWKSAENRLRKLLFQNKINPEWIKADLVASIQTHTYEKFLSYVKKIKRNYFREGIALDKMFNVAFLEQEVNANVFLHGLKEKKPQLALKNINFYRKTYQNERFPIKEDHIQEIYTFTTKSFSTDGQEVHELESGKLSNGCRTVNTIDAPLIETIIDQSSTFLAGEVLESGQFRYGYFPAFDREIQTYNILRHSSTTYSMVEAYEATRNPELKKAIERAIHFLIADAIKHMEDEGVRKAFVIEKSLDNEIKLGANAAAILALAKYTKVLKDDQYLTLMEELARGIEYFQQEDGSFVHVLNYPDLSVKDVYRTIYYDGEAAFGLMRLYDITQDEQWIQIVIRAFDHFIAAEHWKHGDHWLSYCSNELFKYRPERKYAAFNLKNANRMLDFSLTRETAFPTLLELLMASHNMIIQMKSKQNHLDLLESFDEVKLQKAIRHRVKHQLNSYFWPEMAMYFKAPEKIVNSFYIRHHSYRVRIDDVEHNISGYCSYYYNVLQSSSIETLEAKKERILINELSEQPLLKKHVIRCHSISNNGEVLKYVENYPAIMTYDENCNKGVIFKKDEGEYVLTVAGETYLVSYEDLISQLEKSPKITYVQQYVQSITELGLQYKVVCQLSKSNHQWNIDQHMIRVNVEGLVDFETEGAVANINTEPFLERKFPNQSKQILETMQTYFKLIKRFLDNQTLESHKVNIIVGIDVQGEPWIEDILEVE